MSLRTTAAVGILFLALGAGGASAQAPVKLLDTETYFEMESVSVPRISPDGRQILFIRGWADKMNDQPRSSVWIADASGERIRELTRGSWRVSSPAWSPDGTRIAFLSERDETTQIHVLWPDTGEIAQLTRFERPPGAPVWSPDGRSLAFTAFVPDTEPILSVKLPKRPEGAKWAAPAVLVDRLGWRSDGRGPVPKGYTHVYVVDARLGGTPRLLTSGDFNHGQPAWSADGRTIFVSGIRKPEAEYTWGDSEIYAVDLKTMEVRTLTDRRGPDGNPTPSPDGKWIAYTGYDDKNFTSHLSSLYLMEADGGGQRLWAGNLPSSPSNLIWAEDSSGVYYQMEERGENNLYFVPLSGPPRKVTRGTHVLSGVSISKSGTAAATLATPARPAVLVTFPLAKPETIKTLVDVNADVLEGVKLGGVEELLFKAPDGLPLQGWLIKPAEFAPARTYPMLLYIHGGPWSMYSVAFNWDWQNFAANGYAVLFMNPRGSTGYGQDFVNGIQHSYPGKDFNDLMAGVDAALAKRFIDQDNLFVCGGSGGGVLTAWIVGHTDRFRAAVSMRPVINWHSFVGTTDGPNWYRQFQKYPWEDPLEYALRSPLHYVANVKTPTMVMTGEADLRTPISQSEEYYRALKILKKETLLVRMPEEFHGWRRPSHRLLQQAYLMAWFEKFRVKK
ncbi:MAG: S9 family peptidase [Candidatus Aminicenantes bacterium]|nr:S9 family peptidase [Candidatus Aminicenantes bacterium]